VPAESASSQIALACVCGKRFRVKPELAGRRMKCPACGGPLTIPHATSPTERPIASSEQDARRSAVDPFSSVAPTATSDPLGVGDLPTAAPIWTASLAQPPLAEPTFTSPAPPAEKSNLPLILAATIGSGVLLLGLAVGGLLLAWNWSSSKPASGGVAQGSAGSGSMLVHGAAQPASAPPTPLRPPGAAVSEEEARQFCQELEQTVAAGDPQALTQAVDWDEIIQRATASLDRPEESRQVIDIGVRRSGSNLGQQVMEAIQNGGSYRLLRVRTIDGETRAIMRLSTTERGLNYHELWFHRLGLRVYIADLHPFASGEKLSVTLRRGTVAAAAASNRSLVERLTGTENDYVRHLPDINQLVQAARSNPGFAMSKYRQLPASLQQDKSLLLIRIQLAQALGDAEYNSALEDFRRHHPDDPALTLLSIDWHVLSGRYDEALAAIDQLDKAVGGDPHLDVLRAGVCIAKEDLAGARQFVTRCLEQDPGLRDGLFALVTVAIAEGNFAETLDILKRIDQQDSGSGTWGDLNQVPAYAPFVQSPQYQQWLEYLKTTGR